MSNEQRHFTRIPFDASVDLIHSNTGKKITTDLIDISFKGVLLEVPSDWKGKTGDNYTVHFPLAGDEVEINLAVSAVHSEGNHIGFKTEHMDLDSATHLRRIVELNLGNETLLERELSELIQVS